jgi:hypothetical protein
MVKTTLVESDIVEGRRFLDALKEGSKLRSGKKILKEISTSHFRVKAAFWSYSPESSEWSLVIATPLRDEKGPLEAYRDVAVVLDAHPDLNLSLQNISIVSPKDSLVKAFNKAMKIAPDPAGVRFTRSALNGIFIDDAYVYRLS